MSVQAMKQALEALEGLRDLFYQDTIEALRAAIEAAEKQEPVAWMSPGKERLEFSRPDTVYGSHTIPLYKHPVASQFSVGVIDSDGYLYPDHPLEPGTVLYTTPQPAIPAGYALVPVEPTLEMMAAAGWHSIIIDGYKSMLSAAPKPENSHD